MIPKPVNKLATTIFALRDALKEAQVLNYDEEPVINLPLEAGRRFEMWLAFAVDQQFLSHLHPQTLERDDGYYRTVRFMGVIFKWPLHIQMRPDGKIVPQPWPKNRLHLVSNDK